MNICAGISYGAAFIAAWVVIFLPHVAADRGKLLRSLLVVILVGAVIMNVQFILTGPLVLTISIISLIIGVGAVEAGALFNRAKRTSVPALSGLYAFFAIPAVWWLATIRGEGIGFPEVESLLWAHFLLGAIFLTLSLILWVRLLRKSRFSSERSVLTSFITCATGGIAFILTVPWSGEGCILYLFVVIPLFFLAAIILLLTCALILIITHRQRLY